MINIDHIRSELKVLLKDHNSNSAYVFPNFVIGPIREWVERVFNSSQCFMRDAIHCVNSLHTLPTDYLSWQTLLQHVSVADERGVQFLYRCWYVAVTASKWLVNSRDDGTLRCSIALCEDIGRLYKQLKDLYALSLFPAMRLDSKTFMCLSRTFDYYRIRYSCHSKCTSCTVDFSTV